MQHLQTGDSRFNLSVLSALTLAIVAIAAVVFLLKYPEGTTACTSIDVSNRVKWDAGKMPTPLSPTPAQTGLRLP